MDKYIHQLTEDLNNKTILFKKLSDAHAENEEAIQSDVIATKSIGELTGIGSEVFPESKMLTLNQCSQLNECVLNIYTSLNITITDLPKNIPSELLYKILLSKWDSKFDYAPITGSEVNFCTGDKNTCPYGIYCLSGEENEPMITPDRYNNIITEISKILNAGNVCFLNPESLELEEIQGQILDNPEAFYAENGLFINGIPLLHLLWDDYYMFEPPQEEELWNLLEKFIDKITDLSFRTRINSEINAFKPFSHINKLINKSDQRHNWQLFRLAKIESYVIAYLWSNLNNWPGLFRNEKKEGERDSFSIQDKTPDVKKNFPHKAGK